MVYKGVNIMRFDYFRLRIYSYSNVAGIISNILIYGSPGLPVYL